MSTLLKIHLPSSPQRDFLVDPVNLKANKQRVIFRQPVWVLLTCTIHKKKKQIKRAVPLSKINLSRLVLRFLSQNSLSKSPRPDVYCSHAMSGSCTTRWGHGRPRFTFGGGGDTKWWSWVVYVQEKLQDIFNNSSTGAQTLQLLLSNFCRFMATFPNPPFHYGMRSIFTLYETTKVLDFLWKCFF